MQTRNQVIVFGLALALTSAGSIWLFVKLSPKAAPSSLGSPMPEGPLVVTKVDSTPNPPPMSPSEHILAELTRAAWCSDDPQRPSQYDGLTDDELAQTKSDSAQSFCEDAFRYLTSGNGEAIHWFGLGRLFNAFGKTSEAKECLEKAATLTPPFAAAYVYLARNDYSPNDQTRWNYLETAMRLGYTPAGTLLKGLANTLTQEIDDAFADSADADKPQEVRGVSDAAIRLMDPAEVKTLIKNYDFVVRKPGFPARLAYELGRAAFLKKDAATAAVYLDLAARNGSGAACAHLAGPPYTMDEDRQIALLRKAVSLQYEPAKLGLELLLDNRKALSGEK